MDPPSRGPPCSAARQQLFHSSHLLPPFQLQLPPVNSSRSNVNTLPPLNTLSTLASPYAHHHLSPPPSSSLSSPSVMHRTSSSHDEHRQSVRPYKRPDSMQKKREQPPPHPLPPQAHPNDNTPATCGFVKKLYRMLEDQSFSHVVSWGPAGDCFVVKDIHEFTKSVLPCLSSHSNFASFVRQLNKYDFRKIKNTDGPQCSWTFRHPDFHTGRLDALENIKRKAPTTTRKPLPDNVPLSSHRSTSPGSPGPGVIGEVELLQNQTTSLIFYADALQKQTTALQSQASTLQSQITSLQEQIYALRAQVGRSEERQRGLERSYKNALDEMVNFRMDLAQQDGLMQHLIQHVLGMEVKPKDTLTAPSVVASLPTTPVMVPTPPNISYSTTPSTHPPPLLSSGTGSAASAATPFVANPQPQPSVFLQSLSMSLPAPPPPPSYSSLQALGPQSQNQATRGSGQALDNPNLPVQFLPAQEVQLVRSLGTHADPNAIAHSSVAQMDEPSRHTESGLSFHSSTTTKSSSSSGTEVTTNSGEHTLSRISQIHLQPLNLGEMAEDEPSITPMVVSELPAQTAHKGLQVFALSHLLPPLSGGWAFPGEDDAAGEVLRPQQTQLVVGIPFD